MSYKIAIASSDGKKIDLSFGATEYFDIYQVNAGKYHYIEKRLFPNPADASFGYQATTEAIGCVKDKNCSNVGQCGAGGGCGGTNGMYSKVSLISDCRCIVCKKIGFNVTKQLEKLAIIGFDVECSVAEALTKITNYLEKIDGHQSLKGIANSL